MSAPRVIIELSPSRLTVARSGKDGLTARAVRFPVGEWGDRWPAALSDLAGPLKHLVDELQCAGGQALVVYTAPGAVATVFSCPASVGKAGATSAASLNLASVAEGALADNPHQLVPLWTDQKSKPADAPEAAPTPVAPLPEQIHTLGIVERETTAGAMNAWVQGAGLRLEGLIPADAAAVWQVVQTATGPMGEGVSANVVLWLGEHASVLAAGTPRKLMFVRTVAIGTESFVDALTRPIRPRTEGAEPVQLTREQARTILASVGIPSFDQTLPGPHELTGASVLPLLQPVLQRLATEAKQSIRFGLPERDRATARAVLIGPGRGVPQLATAIERLSQIRLAADLTAVMPESGAMIVAEHAEALPRLLPRQAADSKLSRGLRIAAAVGAAASLGLTGVEYFSVHSAIKQDSERLQQVLANDTGGQAAVEQRDRAGAATGALAALDQRIARTLGSRPDWAAVLAALSRETPSEIEIASLAFSNDPATGAAPLARVSASAWTGPSADAAPVIAGFVQRIGALPIVSGVRLGSTQRVITNTREGQNFDVQIELVGLPLGAGAIVAARPQVTTTSPEPSTPPTTAAPTAPAALTGVPTP